MLPENTLQQHITINIWNFDGGKDLCCEVLLDDPEKYINSLSCLS